MIIKLSTLGEKATVEQVTLHKDGQLSVLTSANEARRLASVLTSLTAWISPEPFGNDQYEVRFTPLDQRITIAPDQTNMVINRLILEANEQSPGVEIFDIFLLASGHVQTFLPISSLKVLERALTTPCRIRKINVTMRGARFIEFDQRDQTLSIKQKTVVDLSGLDLLN